MSLDAGRTGGTGTEGCGRVCVDRWVDVHVRFLPSLFDPLLDPFDFVALVSPILSEPHSSKGGQGQSRKKGIQVS